MISVTSWGKKIKQKAVVRRLPHFFSADAGLLEKMQACLKYLWMLALKKFLDVRNYVRRATHCPWGANELALTNTFRANDKIHQSRFCLCQKISSNLSVKKSAGIKEFPPCVDSCP